MSDDLIKDEAEFIRNCATEIETGEPLDDDQLCNLYAIDAHRIADLIDAVEESNKELTLQLLAAHGQAADALDKLDKAVEALRDTTQMLSQCTFTIIRMKGQYFERLELVDKARAVLAELEGKG
jgi:hypothetical protein